MMGGRYRAAAFYGLVFVTGEQEGDWIETRDSSTLALPPYGDETFAIAARASMVKLNPDQGDRAFAIPTHIATAEWDDLLRAWCKASERPWSQPRWWIAGAFL